jgi:hypothetical protein
MLPVVFASPPILGFFLELELRVGGVDGLERSNECPSFAALPSETRQPELVYNSRLVYRALFAFRRVNVVRASRRVLRSSSGYFAFAFAVSAVLACTVAVFCSSSTPAS